MPISRINRWSDILCHEGGAYGVDYCAYDNCVSNIQNYNWQEKVDLIRDVEFLGLQGKLSSLQDPEVRDSFDLKSYCTGRQVVDNEIRSADISFQNFNLFCRSFPTSPQKAEFILHFSGEEIMDVPEEEALFVQKQMWWSEFLKREINELGFTEQEIFFPNNLVVKKLLNLNTPFIETINIDSNYCSMWIFVPFDKYRYVLDIKLNNMFNNTLVRIQMRKRKFLFNYKDTGAELSSTSVSEGFWFHIETLITSSNATLFISGAGLTES